MTNNNHDHDGDFKSANKYIFVFATTECSLCLPNQISQNFSGAEFNLSYFNIFFREEGRSLCFFLKIFF